MITPLVSPYRSDYKDCTKCSEPTWFENARPGPEVIKFEFILKLKIKRNDWCLRTLVRKQPIIALYFEFETVLKFYGHLI